MQFSNTEKKWVIDTVRRQLSDTCTEWFMKSVEAVLLSQDFYQLHKEGYKKEYMLSVLNPEASKPAISESTIPIDVFKKSVLGNQSYTIFKDKQWIYIFANDEADLNFLKLLLTKGDYIVLNLQEMNKRLGS